MTTTTEYNLWEIITTGIKEKNKGRNAVVMNTVNCH